jgi:hypothetical protein
MELIGRQKTEPERKPMFPPFAPIAALAEPAGDGIGIAALADATSALATRGPPAVCGARVMARLGAVLQ